MPTAIGRTFSSITKTSSNPRATSCRCKSARRMRRLAKREWPLAMSIVTMAIFVAFGKAMLGDLARPLWFGFISFWLFAVILIAAFAAVRHAESIAVKLGE